MPNKTPREDQIADLAFFINNPKAGLLHDPGVGKTITAAVYTWYCWQYHGFKSVWTQPKSILKKNRDEILDCTDFAPEDVIIVQGTPAKRLELMQRPGKVFLMSAEGWSKEWDTLLAFHPDIKCSIHDEIHLYYAGHGSKRTQSWYVASRQMKSVIPMSGTVIKGKLDSVYPMLHVIAPQFYGSYQSFMAQHCLQDDYGGKTWTNHEKLKNVLGAVAIRRSFESVYGKQAPVIQVEKCEMHPLQREKYEEFEALGMLELEDRFLEGANPAVMAIRCRQIMAHPERVKLPCAYDDRGRAIAYQDYNLIGKDVMTGKDERMMLHVENAVQAEERLVIFAALVPEQERIYKLLKAQGLKVALINGSVSGPARQKIDADFRAGRLQFIVGSAVTMGIGFNWHFLRMVLFTSLDYGDDTFTQAYKRGIRRERETPLLVVVLEYEKSMDQRIFQIVQRKSEDYNAIDETKEVIFLNAKKEAEAKQGKAVGGFTMGTV